MKKRLPSREKGSDPKKKAVGSIPPFGKNANGGKLADEKLRWSEERFRILVCAVKDYAIFMMDPSGVIISWNDGAKLIKGYRADEIIGKNFSTFYTESDRKRQHPQEELELAKKIGRYEEEGLRVRKDGSTFMAHIVITALYDGDGTLSGFGKVTRDITEKKKSEDLLQKARLDLEERVKQATESLEKLNAELTESNTELSRFAHISSHDLKEPLRMIKIYTEMIRKRYADKLDEKGQQYMSFVVEGATRMDALINDLLAYSEVGKTDALKGEADLGQAVANSLINLKGAIDEAGAQIVVGALPVVQGNEGQLTQVFQNLIGNALKFKGPTRTQIQVDCQSREKDWLVSVKDNGIGIEAQYLEKIFVIFCRLHSREGYPGTGVGLAICKRIVERHGGKIWVRSQPAAGSVFEFTIPRRDRR